MWNTTLTSCDCDAISIPAISTSLPCCLRGAQFYFFSVATVMRFLAVVPTGSPRYQMTPMYYFSRRWALSELCRPLPQRLYLTTLANVQSLMTCNLGTLLAMSLTSALWCSICRPTCQERHILFRARAVASWWRFKNFSATFKQCFLYKARRPDRVVFFFLILMTMVPSKLSLLPQGIVHCRYEHFHEM